MKQRILSSALVLVLSIAAAAAGLPAAAANPSRTPVAGDVTGNGVLGVSDVVTLQNWMLSVRGTRLADGTAGDLNGDGVLDVFDLALMKRRLLATGKPLIPPPVRALDPSMPSRGTERIPVVAVSFPDCDFQQNATVQLHQVCFTDKGEGKPNYPHESIAAYYERSSYGRLHLTGDVYTYTAEHPISYYVRDNAQTLVAEMLTALDAQADFQAYDADKDQMLDALVLALPDAALAYDSDEDGKMDWWPFSVSSTCQATFDGVRPGTYCVVPYDPNNRGDFVQKAAHEIAHAMGLPDYYTLPSLRSYENDGMTSPAGNELMDEGDGDLSACSKLLLGWLTEDEVHVYTGGTQEYTLTSMQYDPVCIMIPRDPDAGYLSEYFLIEYITNEGNNSPDCGNGVRILHVQSEITEGNWGMEYTYNLHSPRYDKDNMKQRILRLVNDYGWFYPDRFGKQYADPVEVDGEMELYCRIDGRTEGFHWYDEDGGLTVDPGLIIRVSDMHPRQDWNPDEEFDWSSSSYDYRDYRPIQWGSSHSITISEYPSFP